MNSELSKQQLREQELIVNTSNAALTQTLEPLDPARLKRDPLLNRWSWALIASLIGAIGFLGGVKYNDSQQSSTGLPAGFPAGLGGLAGGGGGIPDIASLLGGAGGAGGGRANTAQLTASQTSSGEVVLISAGKIYVKMADGTTKVVTVSSGTNIMNGETTTVDRLEVGSSVIVDARTEASGVLAANAIVVQPATTEAPVSAAPTPSSPPTTGADAPT